MCPCLRGLHSLGAGRRVWGVELPMEAEAASLGGEPAVPLPGGGTRWAREGGFGCRVPCNRGHLRG